MMKNIRPLIIFLLALFVTACQKDEPIGSPEPFDNYNGWDTSFTKGNNEIPDQNMVLCSVLNSGDANRLKHFFSKLRHNTNLTFAFIGGSITGGATTTSYSQCYSEQLTSFFRKSFPGHTVIDINKGIGSTDSYFGCCRLDEDILSAHPDLVVVEFSVNDHDTVRTKGAMEGLIRKCLKTDALVVMLISKYRYDNKEPRIIHETLGKYYDIPMISMGSAIDPLLQSSVLNWNDLYADDIHPNDYGHFLSAALIFKHLRNLFLSMPSEDANLSIPPYLYTDIYERSTILISTNSSVITNNTGWNLSANEYDRLGMDSYHAGDELDLNVSWREATLLYEYSTALDALLEVSVDGIPVDTISNHNPTGGYMKNCNIFEKVIPYMHTVKLRNLTNAHFRINYLLYTP